MMGFSARFILTQKLGTGDRQWPAIEAWLQNIENQSSYKNCSGEDSTLFSLSARSIPKSTVTRTLSLKTSV
jgi:hypothetical protein